MTKFLATTHGTNYLLWWVNLYLIHFSMIQAQCIGNGLLSGCACNFINACKWDASTKSFKSFGGSASDLKRFIPNVRAFAIRTSQVAEICEPGSIGIIYDCENRIPIASTIIMTADHYEFISYSRPQKHFSASSQIGIGFQQNMEDYADYNQRVPCYEASNGHYYIEHNWWRALTTRTITPYSTPGPNQCTQNKVAVHKGHVIAAQYGRTYKRATQTFLYTNAIPHFGRLNSGSWMIFEQKLVKWANDNCQKAPLHIIVGCVPSTYGTNKPRFFGEAGFSNYMGPSKIYPAKRPYRFNVPSFIWTAACCQSPSFTRNTAFYSPNEPGRRLVKSVRLSDLFFAVRAANIDVFPGMASCKDNKNYISI